MAIKGKRRSVKLKKKENNNKESREKNLASGKEIEKDTKNMVFANNFIVIIFLLLFSLFLSLHNLEIKEKKDELITERENEIKTLEDELDEVKEGYEEYEEKLYYGTGGAVDYPKSEEFSNYVFPIAKEAFIRYTSPFGNRQDPFFEVQMYHKGVDIATVWRAQVLAIADGTVVEHYPPPGTRQGDTTFEGHETYGGMIEIDHGNFTTLYAHLSKTEVSTGDKVEAGDFIGRVGETGRSRGHHLHLEMIIDNENVNPLLYLSELSYDSEIEENLDF